MESEIIKMAVSQGIWALLFVALLFYVLKQNAKREDRLLNCLEKLDGIAVDVRETRVDVKDIKEVAVMGRLGHG